MPTVELVYDRGCPNVGRARANLVAAFVRAQMAPRWHEHPCNDASTPDYARGFGSPTILVDGRDVVDGVPDANASCRIYRDDTGRVTGTPPVERIVDALLRARNAEPSPPRWKPGWAVLPAMGAALLPKVACPACWPAYAGFLGALGLGFLMDATVLLPLTAVFLAGALAALAFRARARRGHRPLALGSVGAALVMIGKFGFESDAAMYVGLSLFVAASLWNSWPRARKTSCSACSTSR